MKSEKQKHKRRNIQSSECELGNRVENSSNTYIAVKMLPVTMALFYCLDWNSAQHKTTTFGMNFVFANFSAGYKICVKCFSASLKLFVSFNFFGFTVRFTRTFLRFFSSFFRTEEKRKLIISHQPPRLCVILFLSVNFVCVWHQITHATANSN